MIFEGLQVHRINENVDAIYEQGQLGFYFGGGDARGCVILVTSWGWLGITLVAEQPGVKA